MNQEYPPDWKERRRRVYRRDDYTCQNCGARGGRYGNTELHAHHIVPKSQGGGHQLDNLETLCVRCHNAAHDHDIRPFAESAHPEPQPTTDHLEEMSGVGAAAIVATVIVFFIGAATYTYRLFWVALAVFLGAALYESYVTELEPRQKPTAEQRFRIGAGIIGGPILIYVLISLFGWPTAAFVAGLVILYGLYRI